MTTNNENRFSEDVEALAEVPASSMCDFDEAAYLPMLDWLSVDDAQKRECLCILWNMMRMCIEMKVPAETWGQIVQTITEDNTDDSAGIDSF